MPEVWKPEVKDNNIKEQIQNRVFSEENQILYSIAKDKDMTRPTADVLHLFSFRTLKLFQRISVQLR
jgi:hypothetical protein